MLSQQTSVLVVASYLGTTDGGLYAVASQVASMIALAGQSIGYVTLPYISEFHEKGAVGGFVLTLTGHHNRAGVISVVSAFVSLALMIALTPLFGAVGTAIAGALGVCVKGLLVARAVRSCVGISVIPTWLPARGNAPRN